MQNHVGNILGISLVVVRNPLNNKILSVNQKNGTWWLPGGRVDAPETFASAAIRECLEEAGVNINLKGILRIQQSIGGWDFTRIRGKDDSNTILVIFYGEPIDPKQSPKSIPDAQSKGAEYYSLDEIDNLRQLWRGPQLYEWAKYLKENGKIYPLTLMNEQIEIK